MYYSSESIEKIQIQNIAIEYFIIKKFNSVYTYFSEF